MNILITSSSRKVLLVKSFKTIVNNLGGKIICTDMNINSPTLFVADDYFLSPSLSSPGFLDFIIGNCLKYGIKLIIPTRCGELEFYSLNKNIFEKIGCKVMISNIETLQICQDKMKFVEFCEQNNFSIPITYKNKDDIVNFPVFLKPTRGAAGFGIQIIRNQEELNKLDFDDYVVQEYIDWKEYTVDYLADYEGNYINCVPRERISVVSGESCVSKVFLNEYIQNSCKELGNKLKLIGHNTIQCFYKDNQIKFIEINPRFGGAGNLGIVSGLNSPSILINLLASETNFLLNSNKSNISDNLVMLRYSTDMIGYIENGKFFGKELVETNKIYCIDIDGTLCTENCQYEDAKPITKVIEKINRLYDNGNKIVLLTSRGYTSKKDWSELTKFQLEKWCVKYHELHFGKPFADYYIDNKAINILDWN